MKYMALVILLCFISWKDSFSDCGKKVHFIKLDLSTIFGKVRFQLISENESFHEMKHNRIISFKEEKTLRNL